MEHATAHRLAQEIRQSEEYQTYHALKEEVMADEQRFRAIPVWLFC